MKGVLRSMAEAMTQSAFTAPHAAVWMRLDATKTIDLLASLKQRPTLANVRLSPLTIVALALCDAARHYPGVNSSFDAAAGEVIVRRTVNLGIAADTARGLIVPNIKGADQLDLVAMAEALNVLVDKARNGTTTPDDMLRHHAHDHERRALRCRRGRADPPPEHGRDPGGRQDGEGTVGGG